MPQVAPHGRVLYTPSSRCNTLQEPSKRSSSLERIQKFLSNFHRPRSLSHTTHHPLCCSTSSHADHCLSGHFLNPLDSIFKSIHHTHHSLERLDTLKRRIKSSKHPLILTKAMGQAKSKPKPPTYFQRKPCPKLPEPEKASKNKHHKARKEHRHRSEREKRKYGASQITIDLQGTKKANRISRPLGKAYQSDERELRRDPRFADCSIGNVGGVSYG